jgi:hypothetical protein
MANMYLADIYNLATSKLQNYWDDEFVGRNPHFKELALKLRGKFNDVGRVMNDISDSFLEEKIYKDALELMNYACSFHSGEKPPDQQPPIEKLYEVSQRSNTWYPIIEQLLIKQQIDKGIYKFPFEVLGSPPSDFGWYWLNDVIGHHNFKPEKFQIIVWHQLASRISPINNSQHEFHVHPVSPSQYFCFARVSLDDQDLFDIRYDLEISWKSVLDSFLFWLEKTAAAMSLKNSGGFIEILIAQGEGKSLEFKSTLSYDLKTFQHNAKLEHGVLKTIAAFCNSEGGTLLIGIADNGDVHGLDDDFSLLNKKNEPRDAFKQKLDGLITKHLDDHVHGLVHIGIEPYKQKLVAKVVVRPSGKAVFLDKTEFFIRRNAGSIPISGDDLFNYMRDRFFDPKSNYR